MDVRSLFKAVECEIKGKDVDITSIEYDSRHVQPGSLFVSVVGTADDGHKYAAQAVADGAAALLVEHELPLDVTQVVVKDTRAAMALAAAEFYGHPDKKLKMVGITGTNGKTTTTYMVKSIAEQAGMKVGLIGTITNLIGTRPISTANTTPESVDLMKLLSTMLDEGVDLCVMEVSSHSLDQRRVYGIEFDVAVFTNLTQDHLDYHKTFDAYKDAKRKLFDQCKHAVINADDEVSAYMVQGKPYPVTTYAVRENSDIYAKEIDITTEGVSFNLYMPTGGVHVSLSIPGLFSVFNSMAAAATACALDIDALDVKDGLEALSSVSGRLERLNTHGRDFSVILDYAHTPDALENILKTVRSFAKGRLVTLFGCGGDRDKAKRPIMGEIAGRYSDYCVITSDNPRTEDPMDIIGSIEEGMHKTACEYIVIENRHNAIEYAIHNAEPKDTIILAGKGHETYQLIQGQRNHFDEKEIVEEIMTQLDAG